LHAGADSLKSSSVYRITDEAFDAAIREHQLTLQVKAGGAEGFEDEVGDAEGAEE